MSHRISHYFFSIANPRCPDPFLFNLDFYLSKRMELSYNSTAFTVIHPSADELFKCALRDQSRHLAFLLEVRREREREKIREMRKRVGEREGKRMDR